MTRYLALIAATLLMAVSPASARSSEVQVHSSPACATYRGTPAFWVCVNLENAGRTWIPVSGGPVEGLHNCYLLFGEVQSIFACQEKSILTHFDPNMPPAIAA